MEQQKYHVNYERTLFGNIEVEAESEDEAISKVKEMLINKKPMKFNFYTSDVINAISDEDLERSYY